MSAVPKASVVSVADYLAAELDTDIKHEYLGGYVYAMAGGRIVHNQIKGNLFATLHARLRGKQCQPYDSDTKIRVQASTHLRFYYPDVSVVCDSNPPDESFQDKPVMIAEVLSARTRRIDQGEKKDAYLSIPSLTAFLLIEQDFPQVTVYFRKKGGEVEEQLFTDLRAKISISGIGVEFTIAEIYEGVRFTPESPEEGR